MEHTFKIKFSNKLLALAIIGLSFNAAAEEKPIKLDSEKPIKLESNFIGDKEQPLVSYFIPWNEIGTPDKLRWNIDAKNDKTLALVDRKVLLRSSSMYQEMKLENKLTITDEAL